MARDGGNLAAYYLLLHVVTAIFGSGEIILRLPSVLAAVATVLLTFSLGRELAGRRAGLYGAALVGLSLPLVYWAQMVRGYTLGSAFAAASALYFVRARRTAQRRDVFWWAIASILLCWTLLLGALVIVAQLATLALPGFVAGSRRRLVGGALLVAAGALPLALIAAHRGDAQLFWLKRPNGAALRSVLSYYASARYTPHGDFSAAFAVDLTAALVALGLLFGLRAGLHHRHQALFASVFLTLGLGLMPVVSYVVSRISHPIFIDRYFSPCLPLVAMAVAIPLAKVRPGALGFLGLALLLGLRVAALLPSYGVEVDDWRGATEGLVSLAAPGDCLAFYANDGFVDFNYYLQHPPPGAPHAPRLVPVLPARPLGSDPLIVEQYTGFDEASLSTLSARCPRIFLVESHDGAVNGSPKGQAVHTAFNQLQASVAAEYAEVTVRRFEGVSFYLYSMPKKEAPHP